MREGVHRRLSSSILAHAFLLAALGGCASTRNYPVCVLAPLDEAPAVWHSESLRLKRILSAATGPEDFTLTSAGATVHTRSWQHRQLRMVWPSVSCLVGSDGGVVNDTLLRQCQDEIHRYFNEAWSSWPGTLDQSRSPCVRPPESLEETTP